MNILHGIIAGRVLANCKNGIQTVECFMKDFDVMTSACGFLLTCCFNRINLMQVFRPIVNIDTVQ